MRAGLLRPDPPLAPEPSSRLDDDTISADLGLDEVIDVMAGGDEYLAEVARRVLLDLTQDPGVVRHRQLVLQDFRSERSTADELYAIAVESATRERAVRGWFASTTPQAALVHAVDVLQSQLGPLHALHALAADATGARSPGLRRFFDAVQRELDDRFFSEVDELLHRLRFSHGVLLGGGLDDGGHSAGLAVRMPARERPTLAELLDNLQHRPLTFRVADRDEAGAQALTRLRDRGVAGLAADLAATAARVTTFFGTLRAEVGFFLAALNLEDRLTQRGLPTTRPEVVDPARFAFTVEGLYDVGLALRSTSPVEANDVVADGARIVVVTGANRGGKSTFLRSVGLAQLLAQSGVDVPAKAFTVSVVSGVFTHFRRAEDRRLRSGKLDEELDRLSALLDRMSPAALALLNESFASTNEREAAQIGHEVIAGMADTGIRTVLVTHQYELARSFENDRSHHVFLRADGGGRFQLVPGRPRPSSHAAELYDAVFGHPPGAVVAPAVFEGVGS